MRYSWDIEKLIGGNCNVIHVGDTFILLRLDNVPHYKHFSVYDMSLERKCKEYRMSVKG